MEQPAITILNGNCIMTIATVRPDGWPQATIVGYANEGFRLYFLIYRTSQKFDNISCLPQVAITVAHEPRELRDAKAVYAGCSVRELTEPSERRHAWDVLASRHPNLAHLPPPEESEVATMAADCQHVSVVDYTQGIGHTETVAINA
jgi:nitroimidazol reductase NimA-like FMN-containing flavoprotein (pyridoxamine 5'-phosphate oxidase superfamily)